MQSFLSEDRYSPTYNWLILSKSPYLKRHERNPVNWLEWSLEAFDKAKRERKLVFISIGNSSCHECEIMQRESYEDNEIAQLLNDCVISIKVDREERPEIEELYNNSFGIKTVQGGSPLNVFFTPDQKLVYTGTYIPKERIDGKPGFKDVITELHDQFIKN